MHHFSYAKFAQSVSRVSGSPATFFVVVALTLAWAGSGPVFHFSDTWQLSMNTVSSVITFLMVFVIQNTQNRQGDAVQIKLDELIRATKGAQNALLDLEELEDITLQQLKERYIELAREARAKAKKTAL